MKRRIIRDSYKTGTITREQAAKAVKVVVAARTERMGKVTARIHSSSKSKNGHTSSPRQANKK